jgi:Tol biopolymer transport system component
VINKEDKMDINGMWNVFQRHVDGTVEQLTPSNGRYYLSCIRPEGAYAVCQGGAFDDYLRIWRVALNTKEMTCISPESMVSGMPSYSWSGEQVVFSAETEPLASPRKIRDRPTFFSPDATIPMALYVCDHNGNNVFQLTSGEFMDVRPTFSPDATTIAFISKRTGMWRLWEVAADGSSGPEELPGDYTWAMRPWYSVDGREIFFHTEHDGRHAIMRYYRVTGSITPLSNDTSGNTHGAFALRNENALLAHSNRGGTHGLWKFPLDGEEPAKIVIPEMAVKTHATMALDGTLTFDSPQTLGRK